jgi:hypothetical protein
VADFQLRVTAETQDAEKKLGAVQRLADEATKLRQIKLEIPNYSDVSKNFSDLKKDVVSATNSIQQFYRVASKLPVGPINNINEVAGQLRAVGTAAGESSKSVGDAGAVIKGTLETAGKAAETLVGKLTRIAFSLYAINEAVKITQAAFGGLFKETIGREIQLRETILKTQTTLASTNKVFRNNREITDPYEKIIALTGEVGKRIDSIRERSIALAGVTSNEVIEVFGIVAAQVGQIGGGLKEAEDLAINFAAALGTFGIPLYQARQEIGSILRGDITMDSYLAKSLGITNEDIAKAKTEAGGVVKFLEDRLAAAVAGQRIAAEGFAGVVSNIKDLSELINQNFGRGLLDPLIDGLSKVFGFLFSIRKELFSIASQAGSSLGNLLSIGFGRTSGASGGARRTEGGGGGAGSRGTTSARTGARSAGFGADDALKGVEAAIKRVTVEVNKALDSVYLQLATITERLTNAFGAITKGLAALALGLLSLKLEQLKALIGAFEAISPALLAATRGLSGFLAMWGEFLKLPLVQELSQISANMRLLQMTGVIPLIKAGFLLKGVLENWGKVSEFVINQFNKLRAIIGGLIAYIGTVAVAASAAGKGFLSAWQPSGVALKALKSELEQIVVQLNTVGAAAQQAGSKIGSLNTQSKAAGGGIVGLIGNFIKFNLMMFAISAALGLLLERFSAWKEAQDKLASDKRAEEALRRLNTTYKDIGDSADEATKRAKAFEESLVNAKYDEAVQRLEDVRKKIEEIKDLTSDSELDFGDYARRIAQLFNPANFDAFLDRRPNELFSDAVLRKRREQEKQAETDKAKWAQEVNKKAAADNLRLEAQNRVNLEKEIGDYRRQLDNDLFRQRQNLAQKEVEIFRAAGELRIFQMEQANAKLIEGEEGASAAALESLNNYLSTRERGELDIEAAKKSIVIEVANLEREIANYRLENEKKIAEIRKRAGDYEKNVADYRRQQAGQGPVAGVTGLTQGNTGTSTSGPHFHVSGAASEAEARSLFAADVNRQLQLTDSPGSPRGGGRAHAGYDLAGPAGTPLNLADGFTLQNFTRDPNGLGGNYATIAGPGGKSYKVMHLADPGASYKGPGAVGAQPKAPSFDDIGAPAVEKYAEAVRGVASAMERARALQEALTNARTAAAFEAIAKAAFPKVALEEYDNQAIELTGTLDALRGISAELYDPEQIRIAVEQKSKELIAERERGQILTAAGDRLKKNQITQAEFDKLTAQLAERQKKYVDDLAKEAAARKRNLELTKQQNAVESLKRATGAIRFDVQRAGVQAQATMAQAFAGDNEAAQRRIEAELRIAEERIRLEQDATKTTEDVIRELTAFAEKTRSAATELGAMDEQVKRFVSQMAAIREASRAVTDGYKGLAQSFLSGGDLSEAVAQMSRSITDKLTGMVLDAAFKPMEDLFVKTLQDVFGMEDPTKALQEQNNINLDLNTQAIQANTAALQKGASPIPVTPFAGYTKAQLESMDPTAVERTLEQSFAGIGESLTQLGTVADTTGKQTGDAAKSGEQGFGKFLGAMTGVATGALAITGAIQAMQDSEGGTYGTLMGIAGVLGGLGSIFGGIAGLGKKASGGPVSARRPYIVGEIGPELFIPEGAGTIIPNDKIAFTGGAGSGSSSEANGMTVPFQQGSSSEANGMTVPFQQGSSSSVSNAYQGNSSSTSNAFQRNSSSTSNSFQGNSSSVSNAFSTLYGASIPFTKSTERVLAERSERETVAAINNPKPLDVRFESQVINNVEYVTAEQHQRGMAQAAERGRVLTLEALQNSVTSRRKVGIN